jgi:hypothetical protein
MFLNTEHKAGQFYLLTGPSKHTHRRMIELTVNGLLSGLVRCLIAGNRLGYIQIADALSQITPHHYYYLLEQHLALSRAETIFPLIQILRDTPATEGLVLISDLPVPFEDEATTEAVTTELFYEAIHHLKRLAEKAPVVVIAHPGRRRPDLFTALQKAAQFVETPDTTNRLELFLPEKLDGIMGRTNEAITPLIERTIGNLQKMANGLLDEQEEAAFRHMLERVAKHISAMAYADPTISIGLVLAGIDLDQEQLINKLLIQISKLWKANESQSVEIEKLRDLDVEHQAEMFFLRGEIKSIRSDMENGLAEFRGEMLALKFPEYDEPA